VFATGPARARLVEALLEAARRGPPNIPPLSELFQHFRRELGAEVYGSMGIAREDKEGRAVAVMFSKPLLIRSCPSNGAEIMCSA
jgi:hypothetical protein